MYNILNYSMHLEQKNVVKHYFFPVELSQLFINNANKARLNEFSLIILNYPVAFVFKYIPI